MKQLPVAARLYVIAVCVAGALVGGYFVPHTVARPGLFIVLLVCSSVASALKVSLPLATSGSTMSISYAVDFAALLLLGADETMVVAATSAWSQCTFRTQSRAAVYRTLFSMASLVLTVKAAGLVYVWLGGSPPDRMLVLAAIPKPLVSAAGAYFVCNTALIATAIGLSTRQRIFRVWNENFLWSAPSYFVGALAAAAAAWVVQRGGYWTALLTSAPVYLLYRTYKVYLGRVQDEQRHVQEVSDLHLATIEALALAIDAKDQTAQSHIRRVQVYAAGLARALGMASHEIQGVKTAALLHDIGKLAVPEHILSKPGPLTQEEFQKIRIHPQVGAEIISGVPFPYPVAPLILSHHERWDGKGYPAGAKGEDIPLGARILSVVDYFDALMSERPYHKAMTFDAAIGLLRQESGKALDPRVVSTFIEMYPALAAEADASQTLPRKLTRVAAHAPAAQPAVGLVTESAGRKNVFEDIALAHREIYALYEIAQAMGSSLGVADTMALISSKLSNIVPFSCCALFL
ncbi:MAG TPA: HD-GYP domain-containing protein, partial [Vicinamibacterales bacterium]|nr:HD-GYP domain-containing protein [Vicinamibacterales bacterium]